MMRRWGAVAALVFSWACRKQQAPAEFSPRPLVVSAELAQDVAFCEGEANRKPCFAKLVKMTRDPALCARAGGGTLGVSLCLAECARATGDWHPCDHYRGIREVRGVGNEGWVIDSDCYLGAVATRRDLAACEWLEQRWRTEDPTDAGTDLERLCAGRGVQGVNCEAELAQLAERRRQEDQRRETALASCRRAPW